MQELWDYVLKFMEKNNVEMWLGVVIEVIKLGVVVYSDVDKNEYEFMVNIIIWMVGVSGLYVIVDFGFDQCCNWVVVKFDLLLEGYFEVFIVGDVVVVMDFESNWLYLIIV